MAEYDGSIRINTEIEYKNAQKELKSLEGSMSKTADKIASLRQKMDALKDVQTLTQEYKDVQSDIAKVETELGKLLEKQAQMQNEGKDSGAAWDRLNLKIQASRDYIEEAKSKLQELVEGGKAFTLGSDTEKYAEMSAQVEQLNQQMQSDTERQAELQGQIVEWEEHLAELRENAVVGNQRIIETVERIKQLEQEIAELKAAGVTEGYQDYDSRVQELERLRQEVRDYNNGTEEMKNSYVRLGDAVRNAFALMVKGLKDIPIAIVKKGVEGLRTAFLGLGGIAKKAFSSMVPLLKRAASSMTLFGKSTKSSNNVMQSGLKNILKYGLGIRSLYALVNKLRTAIKEGFSNMANEVEGFKTKVDSLKGSTLTLKNSFAAAFRPLVEIAIPYIQMVVDAMANLLDMVGQFMAAITGQKTYTKAIKQTTAAIEEENKAQNKQLSGLDKLNNLSSGSGGGADGGASTQMFEENVPISSGIMDAFQRIKDLVESKDWEGIGAYMADSLNAGLQKVYDVLSWDTVGPKITYFANAFTDTLNSVVNNFDWEKLGKTIGTGINTVVNTLDLIISGIDWTNIGNGLANGLNGLAGEVDFANLGNIIGEKIMILPRILLGFVSNLEWGEIGTQIGNALNGVVGSIKLSEIGEMLGKGLTGVFQAAINFSATFDWQGLGTNIYEGINSFFENTDWATVGQGISDFVLGLLDSLITVIEGTDWQQIGKSIAEFISNIDWIGLAGRIAVALLGLVRAAFDLLWNFKTELIGSLADWFESIGLDGIAGFFRGMQESLADTGNWIRENIFNPFIGWLKDLFGIHSPSTVMAEIGVYLMQGLLNGISSLVNSVKDIWNNMKNTAVDMWNTVKKNVSEVVNNMKTVISAALTLIKTIWTASWNIVKTTAVQTWNGIKQNISNAINSVKSVISTALSLIKSVWNTAWTGMKTSAINIFNEIWTAIKGAINNIISGVESMANGVINGINGMIGALNRIHFDIPDWVPGLGGNSFGINIPTIGNISIPKLATGAVIPANREFLAVLGDQKHGTNIEAPLATIEEAVENALNRHGGTGGAKEITIRVPVEIDGNVLFELIRKLDLQRFNSTGEPSFQM